MNLSKFIGHYLFKDGVLSAEEHEFTLFIAPSTTSNPASPNFQLLFRQQYHPNNNKRLTGLFMYGSSTDKFRGDIFNQGKKETFILLIDRSNGLAEIRKR
jgi:hypothetical protein